MANLVGQTIGQYQIVEQLGRGGMADVYKAFHTGLAVHRAIKVIRSEFVDETDFTARFKREAQAVADMRHPNIVQIHDFGSQDGLYYMVMEFIEGRDLKSYLTEHGQIRPFSQILPILEQVASALSYAHKRGVVHRDIKPANIMLTADNQIILTDFGIAKMLAKEEQMTQTGIGIGTPAYMAPEQARGLPDIGPSADIYSLGIVLYEMLTGRVPYSADTPLAVMLKVVNDPLPPPREFSPDIPDVLQGVVLKATAKEPAQRYQTADAFIDGLKRSLSADPGTVPDIPAPTVKEPAAPPPVTPTAKKTPWLVGGVVSLIIAVCVILAAGGAAVYWWTRPAPSLATWQFVIDASAGMGETIDDQPKIDVARAALDKELKILPDNVNAGLRVFGGQESGLEPCEDTKLLVEPAGGRGERITSALAGVTPQGEAPLTEAIVQAIGDFDLSHDTQNTLIIITAGLDTCEADAISQLETLSRRLGIEFDLHLIGLGVEDRTEAEQLQQLAASAGGSYYDADDEEDISRVLGDQISILQGTPVARATAAATPQPTPANTPALPTDTPAPALPPLSLSEPVNLTNTPDDSSTYGLIMFDDDGYLHFVWVDRSTRELGEDLLHRAMSPDGTWSESEILTTGFRGLIESSVRLARNPNGQACAFVAAAGPSDIAQKLYSICFEGSTTTEPTLVQDQWRDADPAFTPDGTPQTIWNSSPGSLYFGETELVGGSAALIYQPTFTIDTAGTFHAIWIRQTTPFRLEYFSSSDGGQTWSEIEQLTGDEDPNPGWPRLVADRQGNVHLAWSSSGGKNFYRHRTPDEGWGETVEIGPDTQGSAWYDLTIDGDGLAHMVWIWLDMYYTRQQPDGTWTQPQVILADAGDPSGGRPSLAIDEAGARHFTWHGKDNEFYYATLPLD